MPAFITMISCTISVTKITEIWELPNITPHFCKCPVCFFYVNVFNCYTFEQFLKQCVKLRFSWSSGYFFQCSWWLDRSYVTFPSLFLLSHFFTQTQENYFADFFVVIHYAHHHHFPIIFKYILCQSFCQFLTHFLCCLHQSNKLLLFLFHVWFLLGMSDDTVRRYTGCCMNRTKNIMDKSHVLIISTRLLTGAWSLNRPQVTPPFIVIFLKYFSD